MKKALRLALRLLLQFGIHRGELLIGLADITRRVISQNVWLAFGLSVILIALAARGVLDPLTGALSQSVAVLAVVANSARILRFASPRESGLHAQGAQEQTVSTLESPAGR